MYYDRRIVRAAGTVSAQPCTNTPCGRTLPIDAERVLPIVAAATDRSPAGGPLTAPQGRALRWVLRTYPFTEEAAAALRALLPPDEGDSSDDGDVGGASSCVGREPDPPFYQCNTS